MSADKRLFLLDAMALIYRAHFVFVNNPRVTSYGLDTSAVYGFALTLLELLEKEKPSHIAVCFESETPTLREQQFEQYKAHREPPPEALINAIPYVQNMLHGFGIPCLKMDGYEADDVMGTLSKRAEEKGYQVYLMTMDKDMAQLVTEKVKLYRPGLGGKPHEVYGPAEVKAKFGVHPHQIADFLGLKGDASDNIPGVPKVGDKTAVQLLEQFASMEDIFANLNKIDKPALRKTLTENEQQGRMSKELATIHTEVPVEFDEAAVELTPPDRPALESLFTKLEFRTMLKRVFKDAPAATNGAPTLFDAPAPAKPATAAAPAEPVEGLTYKTVADVPHTYYTVQTEAQRNELVAAIRKAGFLCFDTETTSLDTLDAELVGISVALKPHEGYYLPCNDPADAEAAVQALKPLLEDPTIAKVGQNIKYDLGILKGLGVEVQGELHDTMLEHYVIRSEGKHGLDALARQYLGYEPVSIETLIGKKGKNQGNMRDVPLEKIAEYAAEDADIALQLHEILKPELADPKLEQVYRTLDMPLVPVLVDMEWEGIRLDSDFLANYSVDLEKQLAQLEMKIYQLAGERFNINSPKQLGEILFDKLKLGGKPKLTPTGQYATDEETLESLAVEHELPENILAFRSLAKLKSTYVDALPTLVSPRTGRLHTSYNQAVAVTGRLSSNNPNLQNIPIRTEQGREVRRAFIPRDEHHVLLSADYSQIELRIMAHMSGDPALRQAFIEAQDIHEATAAKVFGVPPSEVTFEQRRKAKMVNFGIIYGITPYGLAQRLRIDRGEAKAIIDSYWVQYPSVRTFMDTCMTIAKANGFAETLYGRRHYLANINSRNATVRSFAERNAINTPIQGTAADLMKLAMIKVHAELKRRGLKTRMLLQVHDELVFDVPKSEVEEVRALVKDGMENAAELSVPLVATTGTGDNWLDAH